jgi:spore maturation protein A
VINYVWIGLIVLAIGYGAWLDLNGEPTSTTPPVRVLSDFSQSGADMAQSLDYAFGEGRRALVPVGVPIAKPTEGTPSKLTLQVKGDGSGHRLQAILTSEAGDVFLADASGKLGPSDKFETASFDMATLTPSAENPTAKPSYPLTLTSLAVVRGANPEPSSGTIVIDDATLTFASKALGGSNAKNWMGVLTNSVTTRAKEAIELAIGLIGIIMFWLGLMRIAEQAGLVQFLARMLRPVMKFLFPDIPADGEAMGAIVMNVAANMLGLGNAATPLGLKAMAELQDLNQHKEYASNAQCMLLAINTSSVTIITPTIIGYRAATGSVELMKFWPVMIGATLCSTFFAVLACKILERLPMFRIPLPPQMREANATSEATS